MSRRAISADDQPGTKIVAQLSPPHFQTCLRWKTHNRQSARERTVPSLVPEKRRAKTGPPRNPNHPKGYSFSLVASLSLALLTPAPISPPTPAPSKAPFLASPLWLPMMAPTAAPIPAPTAVFLPVSVAQPLKSIPATAATNKLCLIVVISFQSTARTIPN